MSQKHDAIIFDLDGTLANCEHRLHFIKREPKNYQAFYDACADDTVNTPVYNLYAMLEMLEAPILLASGRPESHRQMSEWWLEQNGIIYRQLKMRPTGDTRPDVVVKKEMLDQFREEGYNPIMAVDDRPSVIKMWRDNGILTLEVPSPNWEGAR